MEIVGHSINTSLKGIDAIVESRNKEALLLLCENQIKWGADRLSFNAGTRAFTEVADMEWMITTVNDAGITMPMMVDSPDPYTIEAALKLNRNGRMMVDSTTCERRRFEAVMPLVKKYDAQVIVLLHDEGGMPSCVEDRFRMLPKVEEIRDRWNMNPKDMLLDNLVFALASYQDSAADYLECVSKMSQMHPEYRYTCGINNVSFGLPARGLLDIAFATMLLGAGQDCLLIEMDETVGTFAPAWHALKGEDRHTLSYIKAFRNGRLKATLGEA